MQAHRTAVAAAAIAAGLALAIPAAWVALAGTDAGRAASDAALYHERVIRLFMEQFPAIDVRNTLTTTTPGYHAAMAAVGVLVSPDPAVLRIAGVAIGAALVAAVAAWCAARRGALQGTLLALPLACSLYVFGSTAWLLPDNAAWLLVGAVLAAALGEPWGARRATLGGLALLALVLVRQVHLWAAAPLAMACLLSTGNEARTRLARRVSAAVAVVLPACIAIAGFTWLWGGLVPPRFRADVTGINPATPAFVLLQFAIAGTAFLPWLWPAISDGWRARRASLVAAAIAGLALAAIPATSTDTAAGRFTGWWNVMAAVPALAGRTSLPMLVLAPAGAVLLAAAVGTLPPRRRAILWAAIAGFVAAVTATHYSRQRYHEPFVLMLLAMLSALQPAEGGDAPRTRPSMVATVGILCAVLAAITWRGLQGEPVDRTIQPAPEHLMPGEHFRPAPGVQSKTASIASATGGQ
jgi:hypothetical protein